MEILGNAPERESGVHAPRKGTAGVAFVCLGVSGLISLLFVGLSPALPSMAKEFGHGGDGTLIAQLVFSLAAVMMIVGALVAGVLSEMVGRRRIIVAGLLVYALAGMGGMVAPDIVTLAATRAAAGLVSGMMLTASYATVGEYYEGEARERMLGFVSMFSSVISVLLFVIGGMIVDWLGWRAMFGLFGVALVLVPPAWMALHHGKVSNHPVPGGWDAVARLWPLYVLIIAYTILIYMTAVQSPFLLTERGVEAATTIGLLLALTSVFGALGAFAYGFMRRYMGFAAMMAFASLTGGGGMVIAGLFPGMGAYIVAAVVIGMGIGIIEPTVASETLSRTPERLHDRAMGINLAAMFLGQFFNPLVMGPLRTAWGIAEAFTIVGGVFVLAGVLFLTSAVGLARRRALA
ncbi:MAG: MFS transporter [Novosphingobium sp.]|nr:MFS transporter [Novosphingobium sp.]